MVALKDSFKDVLENVKEKSDTYTCIAVVGQPGAGKSTLINKLIGKNVAETGSQTDVTRKITAYEYNFMKLLDVPGYGTKLFPFKNWIEDYPLDKYDAIIYVFSGKFIQEDTDLFIEINKWNKLKNKPLFLVRTHSGGEDESAIRDDLHKHFSRYGIDAGTLNFVEFIFNKDEGLDELKKKIVKANLVNIWKERIKTSFNKARDSYLDGCYYNANEAIDTYKKIAAVNGFNPILGADIAVDVGLYLKMFADIRECYKIENDDFKLYATLPIAKKLGELLTKQGVTILIKKFGTRVLAKQSLKWIPFLGQAIAAYINMQITEYAGEEYRDDCKKFAKTIMDTLIKKEYEELENKYNIVVTNV